MNYRTQDFNSESSIAHYGYIRSPIQDRAFLIVKKIGNLKEPVPIGDYTVLDHNEDPVLSEMKVTNLVSLLNGRQHLMQLGHETKSRVLYRIINSGSKEEKAKVLFYHLGSEGISIENALFTIQGEDNVIN